MTTLANQLNSNEAFKPSSTFQADLTVIKSPKKRRQTQTHLGVTSHFRCLTQKIGTQWVLVSAAVEWDLL